MKNIIYICVGLSCILLLCLFLPKTSAEKISRSVESLTTSNTYTVKEYEGQVAVFSDDNDMPIKVFETSVSSLPECDRKLLSTGITVDSPEELQRIIEDFTG